MKILFLSGLYPPHTKGGGEISAHLIARGLVERGHEVNVVTEGEGREKVAYDGVSVTRIPVALTAKPLLEQRHSRRVAKVLRVEINRFFSTPSHSPSSKGGEGKWIIHAHDYKTALVLSELDYPQTIVTARDYAQICGTTHAVLANGERCTCSWRDLLRTTRIQEASWARKPFRMWQYKYNLNYRRESFRKFSNQIFISESQQREIARQQDLSGVNKTVIHNPAPDEYLKLPISNAVHGNVLYVGRVESYKGVELLIRAWSQVVKKVPGATLSVAGEGAQRRQYDQLTDRLGLNYNVKFLDFVAWERLTALYDESQVVVAPHIWIEPFGRTVIEAMARGKTVVAANTGGPAEVIKNNKTGLLFDAGSQESLANKLIEALKLPALKRLQIERAARSWVSENLNSRTIAAQHEKFYRSVIDN
jgi:glycosyltransferase involved in cell wall biosynthesis